ncbi:hypothetical protein ABL78_3368 [Leptomonas seymouri]|uniref:SMP-LTD domain-containing protein n=1 Tax=Leptomonas seymouri TaxID=5684 RepID=A0A0N1ILD4_LEPSE|nr:hypothetical protein ABL78_3368 [Leptomonas seymouri]|eukprot:KPI87571.1 hypothetical protein ABL78_3368 [Leptomonas seymouri]
MEEVNAFIYGWIAGIFAVMVWILYGIDTLLQLMRFVNDAFAYVPGLARLANERQEKRGDKASGARGGGLGKGDTSKFNVLPTDEELEGLTSSTKSVTPITASGLCMMSWYGLDGATGTPVECRLSLEGNRVTVFQLLRLGDTIAGGSSGIGGRSPSLDCGPVGRANSTGTNTQRGIRSSETDAFRNVAGVTVAEHRKGCVSVLHTTVMELKHFNKPRRNSGDQSSDTTTTGGGGGGGKGSETGSVAPSLRADTQTAKGSKHKGGESGSGSTRDSAKGGTSNTNIDPIDSTTRLGVDPLFTGRVLVWRTMDGRPLFDSVHAPRSVAGGSGSVRRSSGSICSASLAGVGTGSLPFTPSADSFYDDRRSNSSVDDGDDGEVDDGAHSEGSFDGRQSVHQGGSRDDKRRDTNGYQRHGGVQRSKNQNMSDMANWSCVIIKFDKARESERWHTLLSGLREAQAWNDFAKTLPNPDTVNTFLSRFFFQNMRLNGLREALIQQIRKKLRELPAKKFPRDLGGHLVLDEFLIGTQIPWITDVSEPTVSADGEVGFDFNLMYKGGEGGFSLFFRLALEFLGIRIPHVVFSVKLIELEATVHVSIGPPPSTKFWIGGHKPPILRLEVHQGCASGTGILHRVLTSLPDLSGLMTNLIKLYLFSDMVLPYMDDFPLPSVVKSPKGSQHDLRVRTFDRRRAAKISSKPVQPTSSPVATLANTLSDQGSSSFTSKPSRSAEAGPLRGSPALRSDEKSEAAKSSSGASSAPLERERREVKKTSLPSPASREGVADGNERNAGRREVASPSCATWTMRSATSPIQLASSNGVSSSNFDSAQCGGRSAKDKDLKSTSTLSAGVHSNDGSDNPWGQSRNLVSETELTESEDVLSAATRHRGNRSSAMRSLRSMLKIKGKDMTRESVSRSKDVFMH